MKPYVKICGVTQRDQALQIAALGADYIGINFWPQSKRYLSLDKAAWLSEVPKPTALIGVFVNPDVSYIQEVISTGLVPFVQLHGDESPDFCGSIMQIGLRVIKAFQIKDESSLDVISKFPVKDILLDAYHPSERGGLGETFPWALAKTFKQRYPTRNLWLAGGLKPENINEAVQGVSPYAVDVASGVEADAAGIKDMEKVARFIQNAKREK